MDDDFRFNMFVLITFTLLPTLLNFLEDKKISLQENQKSKITYFLGNYTSKNKNKYFSLR